METPRQRVFNGFITKFNIILFLLLAVFMRNTTAEAQKKFEQEPPGTILIEMYWPDDINADVDLWVEGPTGGPVGYSRRSNQIFNLLRDDLGTHNDLSGRNFENCYSRGIAAGEYVINSMIFSGPHGDIPVTIVVSVRSPSGSSTTQLGRFEHVIKRVGDEDTVVRLSLTKDGALVPGSINSIPKKVRGA